VVRLTDGYKGRLPPLWSYGGKRHGVGLTWLAGTVLADGDPGQAFRLAQAVGEACRSPGSVLASSRHYRRVVRADDWSWQVGGEGLGGAAGSVYIEARQGALERHGAPDALVGLVAPWGLRASRVDLAWDDPDWLAEPVTLFAARADAVTRTHRASWVLTVSASGEGKLTIGSRSSDRYGRVYVKRPSVRWETETKGEAARALWEALASGTPTEALWAVEWDRLAHWDGWDAARASRAVVGALAR
jgi:hypothetical protein